MSTRYTQGYTQRCNQGTNGGPCGPCSARHGGTLPHHCWKCHAQNSHRSSKCNSPSSDRKNCGYCTLTMTTRRTSAKYTSNGSRGKTNNAAMCAYKYCENKGTDRVSDQEVKSQDGVIFFCNKHITEMKWLYNIFKSDEKNASKIVQRSLKNSRRKYYNDAELKSQNVKTISTVFAYYARARNCRKIYMDKLKSCIQNRSTGHQNWYNALNQWVERMNTKHSGRIERSIVEAIYKTT